MRLGIPVWRDEVSPVFDVAAKLLVIDIEDAQEIARRVIPLGTPNEIGRAGHGQPRVRGRKSCRP